jgi:hypothetical protein
MPFTPGLSFFAASWLRVENIGGTRLPDEPLEKQLFSAQG